ncbi:hypothetical protein E7811_15470 [Aliigemmobacter aestuarii]|uniref:Uncharacterized protein n=1 Tax=Aliigemmobacter aestuarii TaxID=1445661 RepID=A0A4S3MLH9_9RHOB|nr:hypothetical protein [Gemmobacter aestuarii]THD82440.1 hypothetical protein E7811_15470 [Gemmobacter aestuarii]
MAGPSVQRADDGPSADHSHESGWRRLDKAAFGIVYGAITVLAILMAAGAHPVAPFETAAVLFGSVLAITLAKTFAEFLAHALDAGERLSRSGWREAWHHSTPTLATANLPTLLFVASGLGWMQAETALLASQAVCVALLGAIGARIGYVLHRSIGRSFAGALFAGGIGVLLAVMKHVIH